jgi:hypothetical protein
MDLTVTVPNAVLEAPPAGGDGPFPAQRQPTCRAPRAGGMTHAERGGGHRHEGSRAGGDGPS